MPSDLDRWDKFSENLIKHSKDLTKVLYDHASTELLLNIQDDTPVDTGELKSDWTKGNEGYDSVLSYIRANVPIAVNSNTFTREFVNEKEHGYWVNYGHHQEVGRFVPKIQKRLVRDYVPGTYFLEGSLTRDLNGTRANPELNGIWERL